MNRNYHKLKNLLTTVNVEKIPMTIRQQNLQSNNKKNKQLYGDKIQPEMEVNSQIHDCNSEQ